MDTNCPCLVLSTCFLPTLLACWPSPWYHPTALSIPLSLLGTPPPRMRGITAIPIRLCTRECMCCQTIHHANMTPDHYTTYIGSCLLVPWGMQYHEDSVPKVTKPHNHCGPLINPKSKGAYPMYDIGNFTLDDTLFPRVPGDSFLYDGNVQDQLEQQGFDIPTYVDRSLWVTSVTVPIPPSNKALAPATRTIAPSLHSPWNQTPLSQHIPQRPKLSGVPGVPKCILPRGSPGPNFLSQQTLHKNSQQVPYPDTAARRSI